MREDQGKEVSFTTSFPGLFPFQIWGGASPNLKKGKSPGNEVGVLHGCPIFNIDDILPSL